jgi:dipeptidyl aminopeptidase/acylaminoacyl peptidase
LIVVHAVNCTAKVRFALDNDIFLAAAWSPDGRAIAYIRADIPNAAHVVLETKDLEDGKTRILLTDSNLERGGVANVLWLPDGRILFGLYTNSIPGCDLWALTLDPSGTTVGKPERLTNTTGLDIANLNASADGKRVAVLSVRGSFALFVANLDRTGVKLEQPIRLTNDSWNNWPGTWTPDSQTLFYGSERGKISVYKRRISSDSAELFLAGPGNYVLWGLSQDGRWYIATVDRKVTGKRRLLRVPVSGGTPETILIPDGEAEVHCATAGSPICVLSEFLGKQIVFSTLDPIQGRVHLRGWNRRTGVNDSEADAKCRSRIFKQRPALGI